MGQQIVKLNCRVEVVDISQEEKFLVKKIRKIMTTTGVFYITGYDKFIDENLITNLQANFRQFFQLPAEEKAKIDMKKAGISSRGWFPLYGELTFKEGMPEKSNFHQYRMIRMSEAPKKIDVHFVANHH